MYPNLYFFFLKEFNWQIPILQLFNTFGLFVAIAFISAAYFLRVEIKRKEKLRYFTFIDEEIIIGKKPTITEFILNFFIGFLIGYKIIGFILVQKTIKNPQEFIFSTDGNLGSGFLIGIIIATLFFIQKQKQKLSKPEKRSIRIWPSDRINTIVFLAFIWGLIGAKLFFYLESWPEFIQNPMDYIFSLGGLTFYGGLIAAGIAIFLYLKKKSISTAHFVDSTVLTLLLAYGIGRLGCHFSGDGDWGIVNHNVAPKYIPHWLWSYNYPNNVINEGEIIKNCTFQYCHILPEGVYPTSVYEAMFMIIMFIVLWLLRKKITTPWLMTGIYFLVNGLERFFIEKIRVNFRYDFGWIKPTQAEIISLIFIFLGLYIILKVKTPIFNKKA